VLAVESATGVVVGLPLERLDHSHHPIAAATTSRRRITIHGAPRFLSLIPVSAMLPLLSVVH
jgi:hypothetical protein